MTYPNQPPAPCEVGDRIELIKMGGDDPCPIKAGTQGTVVCVGYFSNAYQITVDWDSPRSLALVTPPDEFRVLPKEGEPPLKPFQTTVIFGEEASKAYFEDPEISDTMLDKLGQFQTYSFDTEAELEAFHLGLKEIDGWAGYAIRTPDEPALV